MKHIIFVLAWILIHIPSVSAIKLSEVLAASPVGKNIAKWNLITNDSQSKQEAFLA